MFTHVNDRPLYFLTLPVPMNTLFPTENLK